MPVRQAVGSQNQSPAPGLARELSRFARELQAERDLPSVLQRIAGAAVAEIEHVEYAGISLIERGAIRTAAATDPMVRRIDEMQYRVEQGPCLTSLQDQLTIRSNDLENDGRWPRF